MINVIKKLFKTTPKQYAYKIIIPTADNNGQKFTEAKHLALLDQARKEGIQGGTFEKSNSIGFWFNDNGKLYQEKNFSFTSSGNADLQPKLKRLANFAKKHYKQEAIYFEMLPASIQFI